MPDKILTFSQRLTKLLDLHSFTQNQFIATIGCSRSELKKILSDETTAAQRQNFYEKIRACKVFSPQEETLLASALKVSKFGANTFRFQHTLDRILTGHSLHDQKEIRLHNGGLLSEHVENLKSAKAVDIIVVNSCFSPLFFVLNQLFTASIPQIHMRHYIHSDAYAADSAAFVGAIFPLLFDPRYQPYLLEKSTVSDSHAVGGNIVCFRAEFENQTRQFFYNLLDDETAFEMQDPTQINIFGYFEELMAYFKPSPLPLKEQSVRPVDFSSLCMTFLSHELNRATYSLTGGICFHQIPTEIALAALKDKSMFPKEELAEIIEQSRFIHDQRIHNLYHKKKPSYIIMSIDGCRAFLKTGCSTDHFIGFRPFTPAERKLIFEQMIEMASKNSYFLPLLLRENVPPYLYYVECYDRHGVSFDIRDTDYDIASGYRSVILMFPEFTQHYKEYYLQSLVAEKCYTREESLALFKQLLNEFMDEYRSELQ